MRQIRPTRKNSRPAGAPDVVFLIGFSGCGKSTLGPRLARKLKARFYDTDALIEKKSGRRIAEIFRDRGEAAFRTLETETIRRLAETSGRKVMALGGGAFSGRVNRDLIVASGLVVYLSCPVRELYRRLHGMSDRPLLEGHLADGETMRQARLRRIAALLERRQAAYQQAHAKLSTADKTIAETVELLYRKVKQHARLARQTRKR